MACVDELFIGDEGTSIEFLVKECNDEDPDNPVEEIVNISSATAFQIVFIRPEDETTLIKTNPEVKLLNSGVDGLVHYITLESDLNQEGTWKAQLRVTMPTGRWYTSIINFKVKATL